MSKKSDQDQSPSEIVGPKKLGPQVFLMKRHADETGVSGTGIVAEGCVLSNGRCLVTWRSAKMCIQNWDSFEAFKEVHIDPHPTNNTEIKWITTGDENPWDEETEG